MATVTLTIDGAARTDLRVRSIRASYTQPWEAEVYWPGRHDAYTGVNLWGVVVIREGATVRFRGNVTEIKPGGVDQEGITYICQDRRFRLENEPVRINSRSFYVWNRQGMLCDEGIGGEDSPGKDGGKWTAGEIIIDILEHALGLPVGGSDIPGHHGATCCVTGAYLLSSDVAGYTGAAWLALDSVVGEFSVDNTSVAEAISLLLGLNGGFYGWYVDPDTRRLILNDLDSLPTADIQAGELGQWQDAGGTNYRLLGNELAWTLDGVCSTIAIEGADKLAEEQPANIEGSSNPGLGDHGELELVAAPWKGFAAAYRAKCQPKRKFTAHEIDPLNTYTPPVGWYGFSHLPRIYQGTNAGAKYAYNPSSGIFPTWMLPCGIIGFYEAPALGPGEKLWGWYWAEVPFVVGSGPDGDAYDCYGYQRTRTAYDAAFKDVTSWPQPGTADDAIAMGILADRLLRLYKNVRREGTLKADQVDFGTYTLGKRYNVTNLGPGALGETTPEPPPCTRDPLCWETLAINAVDVTWDLEADATELHVANTFFMLPEYSELKRRLELNLFAQRSLHLSEDLYECQVIEPSVHDDGTENLPTTTTAGPTTTPMPTTEGPTTTPGPPPTTTPGAPTTTPGPPPTTTPGPPPTTTPGLPTTSTTEGPTTSTTTEAPTTSTTTEAPTTTECPTDCDGCASEVFADTPAFTCGGITCHAATIAWLADDLHNCYWLWDYTIGTPPRPTSGVLACNQYPYDGHWSFQVDCVEGYCVYTRPARGPGDCPDGNYSLVASGNCDDCPTTLTIYH